MAFTPRNYARRSAVNDQVHKFRRNYLLDEIDIADGINSEFFSGYEFNLAQLSGVADFSALYEEYRITGVKLKFIFNGVAGADSVSSTAPSGPIVRVVEDVRNGSTPASMNELRQHGDCRVFNLGAGEKGEMFIRPRLQSTAFDGATADVIVINHSPKWISTASTDASHYGLKVGIDTVAVANDLARVVQIEATMYFECKGSA